jgi:hypothetical protein
VTSLPKAQRAQANRNTWLSLAGSFVLALTLSSIVPILLAGDAESLMETLAIDAISGFLFVLFSAGVLLRHRTMAKRWAIATGAVLGIGTYAATWALWFVTEPSFRHAVPFELLTIALSTLFGLLSSGTFYVGSIP